MPATAPKGQRGGILLRGVHCFTAGDWQGRRYTTADLDDIVSNFNRFSAGPDPLVEVPFVIGHEEEQPLTGVPAVGWVRRLSRRGPDLFADVEQLFPAIARLVERGAYTRVSPEIYDPDSPPEGVPAEGCMMRRLSALGGELPHIKQLAPLPMPLRLSERAAARRAAPVTLAPLCRVWHDQAGAWACFSEVRKMADDATEQIATAAIQAKFPELPPELIESLTPDQLSMLAPAVGAAPPAEGEPGTDAAAMQEPPAGVPGTATTREEMIAELVALGEDPAALEAMSDADLEALYRQRTGQGGEPPATPMSEAPLADPLEELLEETTVPDPTPAQPVKRQPAKVTVTQQFSERRLADLERRLKAAEAQQKRTEQLARQRHAQEQRRAVRAFCERLARENRASPAEVEFGKDGAPVGPIAFALSTADAVRKFAEHGGKTALEVLMEKLEQRPARHFGEQVQDPVGQSGRGADLSPERERQLLGYTRAGKRLLAERAAQEASHRSFAEALGNVIGQKLNGRN